MKLNNLVFDFERFAVEMANLKEKKHFDYLVTIIGEDFGPEEGLGCIYILEYQRQDDCQAGGRQ